MTRTEITVVIGFVVFLFVMFWIGGIRWNIAKDLSVMSIEQKTGYEVAKATSIMKRVSGPSSIILVVMHVQLYVRMIGLISLANWQSITSADYTSLKEMTQAMRGISHVDIIMEQMAIIFITLLMIYLARRYQLLNNNIKTRTSHHLIN